jgi:hypothetical protein
MDVDTETIETLESQAPEDSLAYKMLVEEQLKKSDTEEPEEFGIFFFFFFLF